MPKTTDIRIERLRRLPINQDAVWQGRLVHMSTAVTLLGEAPFQLSFPLWLSLHSHQINFARPVPVEEEHASMLLDVMVELACNPERAGYRPRRLEVSDAGHAAYLRESLAGLEIEVAEVERTAAVDAFAARITKRFSNPFNATSYIEGEGVDVERLSAFAGAAAEFYRARPWLHLNSDDLVEIESAVPDDALSCFTVAGGRDVMTGLGFFASPDDYEAAVEVGGSVDFFEHQGTWAVLFGGVTSLPIADAALWLGTELPVAGGEAYPVVVRAENGEFERPGAEVLTFIEGVLRALAATTEDELDSGRWRHRVATHDGERAVAFALPALLEAEEPAGDPDQPPPPPDRRLMERTMRNMRRLMENQEFASLEETNAFLAAHLSGVQIPDLEPRSPEEEALDVVYQALEARGRRSVMLARRALRIDPDCADAFVLLAEQMPDLEERMRLLVAGMAAGERALDPRCFEEQVGHFWGILETRPYMRARKGYAECLVATGDPERANEALEHYRELLRLNPDDNQGVRYLLAPLLLACGRDAEAETFLAEHADDPAAAMLYARALWRFRREGDSPAARRELRAACKANPHVPPLLLGDVDDIDVPDSYGLGDEDEAILCAVGQYDCWAATGGALDWLRGEADAAERRVERAQRERRNAAKRSRRKGRGGAKGAGKRGGEHSGKAGSGGGTKRKR